MGEKKNIDRLYREKFKDFEQIPHETVWNKIENSLDRQNRENRRVLPFWWRLGGMAAAIALLVTIGYNLLTRDQAVETQVPVTNIQEDVLKTDTETPEKIAPAEIDQQTLQKTSPYTNNTPDKNPEKQILPTEKKDESLKKQIIKGSYFQEEKAVADIPKPVKEDPALQDKAIASLTEKEKTNQKEFISKEVNTRDASASKETVTANTQTADVPAAEKETDNSQKPSILEAIAGKEEKTNDTEEVANRWSVSPTLAPVYFNTMGGDGSPIHSQFADNSKSGNINLSYGINVSYKINERLSVRSGVNRVNYGYNTNDVSVTSVAVSTQAISTINYSANGQNLVIGDKGALISAFSDSRRETNALAPTIGGELTQELGYLEVPLELKYRVVNRRLSLNVIGGISSLFLTDNALSVNSDELVTNIGEANNLNNINFSTNIGFGLDYRFTNNLFFSLEPLFKYQLSTFSRDSGGFNPYSVGVYTGISFSF
ncbi:outer membrane beta-barrel protein [Ascidiimonas aurantiaca]|uniref:outer membrane beta-barrel protein n=1 Tax=Ascidiimonas aurantiaca TaxID=1685432 RepID=UPI0030ECF9E1